MLRAQCYFIIIGKSLSNVMQIVLIGCMYLHFCELWPAFMFIVNNRV